MIFAKKESFDVTAFWSGYEKKTGEKVLAKALGRYIGGCPSYAEPLWGLAIATSGGFRFHHFPHESWLMALSRVSGGGEAPKEKTIFIPKENIIAAEFNTEKSWWKKLFFPSSPVLAIRYRHEETEMELRVESGREAAAVFEALAV